MFQSRFGNIDKLGWWGLEIISADAETQFTSTEFKEEFQTKGDIITLAQFEEGSLLSETCDNVESGSKTDDDLTMPPIIS